MQALHWDLYCRVVDNLGDAGVCWRLAADLAARGHTVRLVIDDPAPLGFMAPGGVAGVQVQAWPGVVPGGGQSGAQDSAGGRAPTGAPSSAWSGTPNGREGGAAASAPVPDVVIEAFGCDPPDAAVAQMLDRAAEGRAPVWINLEYLSAEPWVERSHGLRSPQRNGLDKWFFFPGFTPRTGGLLREADLPSRQAGFDRNAWLASLGPDRGLQPAPGERVVSLFCYDNPALPGLLQALAQQPTLLLATPGPAQRQLAALPAPPPALRVATLPWLSQADFDHLLWASDLNFVRGEDSLVRALWAGAPMVWQAYPQHDGVHALKVQAVLDHARLPADVAALWRAWNGMATDPTAGPAGPTALRTLPAPAPWRVAQQRWRDALWAQDDLATQLQHFVLGKSRIQGASGC